MNKKTWLQPIVTSNTMLLFQMFLLSLLAFDAVSSELSTCDITANFSRMRPHSRITNTMTKLYGKPKQECYVYCAMLYKACQSVNINSVNGDCELSEQTSKDGSFEPAQDWYHVERAGNELYQGDYCIHNRPCPNHDSCISDCVYPWYKCKCKNENYGNRCRTRNPCHNGGTCIDTCTEPGYNCECQSDSTGQHCTIRQNTVIVILTEGRFIHNLETTTTLKEFTSCFWYKTQGKSLSSALFVFSVYDRNDHQSSLSFQIRTNVGIGLRVGDKFKNMATVIRPEYWNHVCITWSGFTITIYLNGTKSESTTITHALDISINEVSLGRWYDANYPSPFPVQKFSLFNIRSRALEKEGIQEIYNGGVPQGSLISWKPFLRFTNTNLLYREDFKEFNRRK